jgi:hypothetical protein
MARNLRIDDGDRSQKRPLRLLSGPKSLTDIEISYSISNSRNNIRQFICYCPYQALQIS